MVPENKAMAMDSRSTDCGNDTVMKLHIQAAIIRMVIYDFDIALVLIPEYNKKSGRAIEL